MEITGTVNKSGQTLDAAVSTGTRSLTGGVNSGIGAAGTVKYIPQTLTEEQKAQARENIGAAAPGETGAGGKSAYEYAVAGGYTGTEEEFAKKLAAEYPTKTSQLQNDSGFITGYTETDPTVPDWAKQSKKPSYTADEVGALPANTVIPTKTSQLQNDSNFVANFTESDPTVPAWAKAATKPSYTAAEVGARPSTWTPTADDVGALPADTVIPSKTSQITNDSGFINKAVSDLTNYYKKSETYTKTEIDAKVSAIPKFSIVAVDALPTTGISETTVYLVKSGDEEQNLYVEYIFIPDANAPDNGTSGYADDGGTWEKLGEQTVDLTGYATEAWVGVQLGNYQPKGDYALRSDVPTKVSQLTNDKNYMTNFTETDPTVPAWAKAASKPSYSKSEVGLGNVENVKQYSASNPPPYPVTSVNSKTGAVSLTASDVGARPSNWTPSASDVGAVPTTRKVNGKALSADITLAASDVGAVPTTQAITVTGVDADGVSHSWTMYGVKN